MVLCRIQSLEEAEHFASVAKDVDSGPHHPGQNSSEWEARWWQGYDTLFIRQSGDGLNQLVGKLQEVGGWRVMSVHTALASWIARLGEDVVSEKGRKEKECAWRNLLRGGPGAWVWAGWKFWETASWCTIGGTASAVNPYLHSRIGIYSKITCVSGDLSSAMILCLSLGDCSGKLRIFKFLLHLDYQLVQKIPRIQKPINKMT